MAKFKAGTTELRQVGSSTVVEEPSEGEALPDTAEIEATVREMLAQMDDQFVNILIIGATGSRKSSIVNALFNMSVAKVGATSDPETKDITSYVLGNLTLQDTLGLGDSDEADAKYAQQISLKLDETNDDGDSPIDIALVVLDASSKEYVFPAYQRHSSASSPFRGQKILVAVNQADIEMKGNH